MFQPSSNSDDATKTIKRVEYCSFCKIVIGIIYNRTIYSLKRPHVYPDLVFQLKQLPVVKVPCLSSFSTVKEIQIPFHARCYKQSFFFLPLIFPQKETHGRVHLRLVGLSCSRIRDNPEYQPHIWD